MVALSECKSPTTKRQRTRSFKVNPYHELHVRSDATASEVRQSYQRLALWYHPGRCILQTDEEEIERRTLVFEILAACYETLVYHRNHYDTLLHNMEYPLLKGEIYVGGKRTVLFGSRAEEDVTCDGSHEDLEHQFTNEDTYRMFAGPWSLLYKARNFEPFSDPYDVFDSVFGHSVFSRPPTSNCGNRLFASSPTRTTTTLPSSSLTGSTTETKDGSVICVTSRNLVDRKVVKRETTTVDASGRKHVAVEVTSEQLGDHDWTDQQTTSFQFRSGGDETRELEPQDQIVLEDDTRCSWLEMNGMCCGTSLCLE